MGVAVPDAVVVVPARDEAQRIGRCLSALARQSLAPGRFEVIVVLDACGDDTGVIAAEIAAEHGLALTLVEGPGRGTGPARRAGMELACDRLLAAGRPHAIIATTDADSQPAQDWLARQLAHVEAGAGVIAGRIELDPAEADALPASVLARRQREACERLERVRRHDPGAAHHHFAGASLAITAELYRSVGGLEPLPELEDDAFAMRLAAHGIAITRPADVTVTTSARTDGRATRGLSVDLAVSRWLESRRYRSQDFSVPALAELRARLGVEVSVVVPVKECARTIGQVLEMTVGPLRDAGLVGEVVVVDADSVDGSAQVASSAGARVVQQDELCPELGPALGKGDAMWRGLWVCGGEIVCFLDGDTADPAPRHLLGLIGPLLGDPGVMMVRGSFERPFAAATGRVEHEGGRVTELMARPLLNLYEPLLAGFGQPLAGEFSARREVLEALSFPVGYGVEIATLIDTVRAHGLDAMAECGLGTRQNRHQPLRALGEMAYGVLAAVERRREPGREDRVSRRPSGRYLRPWSDETVVVPVIERPPLREYRQRHLGAALSVG